MTEYPSKDDLARIATPRPWQRHDADGGAYVYAPDARYKSLPGNPSPVKVAWLPPSHTSRPLADAALIVEAVNDYDRLRRIEAAARDVVTLPPHDDAYSAEDRRDIYTAALRAALDEEKPHESRGGSPDAG